MKMLETLARAAYVEERRLVAHAMGLTPVEIEGQGLIVSPTERGQQAIVRAVLLALRSPDEGMVRAACSRADLDSHHAVQRLFAERWQMAIDHILTSEAGK